MRRAIHLIVIFTLLSLVVFAQVDAPPTQSGESIYLVDSIGNAYTSSSSGTVRALDVRDRWTFDAINSAAASATINTQAIVTSVNNNAASTTAIVTSSTVSLINTLNANNASNTAITSAGTTAIVNEIRSASVSNTAIVTSSTVTLNNTITSGTSSIITANNTITTSSTASLISTLNTNSASQVSQSVSSTVYIATAIEKSIYDAAIVSDRNDGGAIAAGGNLIVNYPAVPAGQVMEIKQLWGHSTAAWRIEVYVDGVMKFDNTTVANVTQTYVVPPFRLTAGQVLQLRKYNRNAVGNASVYSILWYAMRTL